MITFSLNESSSARSFDSGLSPRLCFICKAEGKDEALPRVMHKHEDRFELMFIRAGGGCYNIDGRTWHVKKGDILLFNANVLHDECPAPSEDLLILSCGVEQLKIDGLPMNTLTTRSQPAVMPSSELYDEICQLFDQIWSHVNSKRIYRSEIADKLLCVLLLLCRNIWMENKFQLENYDLQLGQRIKDYIDNHYKEDIALSTITAAMNMNQFYLAHVFKAYSGYSPKHYQTRRRIGEAQNLLLSTDLGVTEVANAVGYDNVNNFHRIFNNLVGIPPARYKKAWINGQVKK
ncbi:AraC family transcriptional regulator [Pantoea vagans]|uniref:AraC family transcriptional regulator n=1 Tax=Pantoea vagans TaxID=470934 RepID=UPI0022501570|nr:AraC family transcriptional regulator [Pantoea vagans]MCX3310973.1 AraC family transcriptional regulator [Pantoea vagans]